MEELCILLLRPESENPSPIDQTLGARLSAAHLPAGSDVSIREESFPRDDLAGLERKLVRWKGKISAVLGATNVTESVGLGQLAERMNLLCFVANNNPSVWQGRRHVFHIGLPTSQTTAAVAALIKKTNRRRVLLIHDHTEFQARVASSMEGILRSKGLEPRLQPIITEGAIEIPNSWMPDLVYVIFSNEHKALLIARAIHRQANEIPLLFGRSLLRESFLTALGPLDGEFWFVDIFHRNAAPTESQKHFIQVMATHGTMIPTANHAFGWDGMRFCASALTAARGNPLSAIAHLESGVILQGASGNCSFGQQNHNGRSGFGPTTLTRWHQGQLQDT